MKRILYIIFMCACALGLLSGCGGEFAEETEAGKDASGTLTGAAVSGHDVSGQAVSGEAVSGQAVQYYYERQEEGSVTRICLESGEEKRIPIDGIDRIIYVEKDALYYTKPNDHNKHYCYGLWRAPIERQADGSEEPETGRAERVKGVPHICCGDDIYMDEEYIVYREATEENVIRHDRRSGKKVRLPDSRPVREWVGLNEIDWICRYGDRLDYMDVKALYYDDGCLYVEVGVTYADGDDGGLVLKRRNETGSSLEYEKGLSEYMWAERERMPGNAECFDIRQGRAYVQCWDQESDGTVEMIYDLKTGEARRASWKDGLIRQQR